MGNILIALGVLAIVVFITYLIMDKKVNSTYYQNISGWKGWWEWQDGEERFGLAFLATIIFLASWGITTLITRGIVSEKYTEQRESTVSSYGGTGYDVFTIGRYGNENDGYYYVYENTNDGLKEVKLYSKHVSILPNTFDADNSNTATLITEVTIKKIKRSKMPFMFLSGKDVTKEAGNCSCSDKYILKVPTKYVFADKFRENERRR
jgi:hypothetical protein